ncbi:MAG: type I-C CRISPR-associated protein Cas5c [Actinobacteria bacterium]|nr:type I-C CRISPR-associated protein Cas5c [Actinomycetota bacterium]
MENKIEFKVCGNYALFTDPLTKIGGEKCSYYVPTYEALKGIISSVYWKPTIVWIIDKVRIMNLIRTQTHSAKPLNYGGIYPSLRNRKKKNEEPFNELSIYNYLYDVKYQVQAHFEWNFKREDMSKDRNENKHYFVAQRMIKKGGRRDIFLGTRECQGYVEPCIFGEDRGIYDDLDEFSFGLMFHGFDYPDELGKEEFWSRFWNPIMKRGVIKFIRPENCAIRKFIKYMRSEPPTSKGLHENELLEGFTAEGVYK